MHVRLCEKEGVIRTAARSILPRRLEKAAVSRIFRLFTSDF